VISSHLKNLFMEGGIKTLFNIVVKQQGGELQLQMNLFFPRVKVLARRSIQ